jgi:cyclopropane-fatty-acyl-phospholipid synthase
MAENLRSETPMAIGKSRALPFALRRFSELLEKAAAQSGVACEVRFASGDIRRFGAAPPQFTVIFRNDSVLRRALSEVALGEAYIKGEFEIEGDMLAMQEARRLLNPNALLSTPMRMLYDLFMLPATVINKRAIMAHYEVGNDFFRTFMDTKYRFYSHCLFYEDDETLEQAAEHKLETMYAALKLGPGKRLLDIGAGWGGVHEYCGPRDVHVTSVTISEESEKYVNDLIARLGLDHCAVKLEDFLEHVPDAPYDGVVIYGVIEHIPYYRRFAEKLWSILKPGGLFYLDASASLRKYDVTDFARRYIWQGSHSFLCLQDIVQELLYAGFDVLETKNESHDYWITMRHWAERLDAHREEIVARWGAKLYRVFRLYLWTGAFAFRVGDLRAYHLVARRRDDRGPRPGVRARIADFIRSFK